MLAIGLYLFSAAVGSYSPGLGRSETRDWTVEGGHVAERNQAFVMIELGESIVIIGASLASLGVLGSGEVPAYILAFASTVCLAFASTVCLWWVYFDRSAAYAAHIIATHRTQAASPVPPITGFIR